MQILILHGWQQNRTFWSNTVTQLQNIATTRAIDLPGFGDEKLVSADWGVPEYSQWVENYVNKNKMDQVVLVGHSFGGRIASWLAKDNPKWLKAIILVAAPSIRRPSKKIKTKIKVYKTLKSILPAKLQQRLYSQELQAAKIAGLEKVFTKVVNFDQTQELKGIKLQTLLIWGENDKEVPLTIAKQMNNLIQNSKLIIIPDSGHMPHWDNPNLFYGSIKKFLQNLK